MMLGKVSRTGVRNGAESNELAQGPHSQKGGLQKLRAVALAPVVLALGLALPFTACGSGGGGGGTGSASDGISLMSIHSGRLVDVYGLVGDGQGNSTGAIQLVQTDVLIGNDIQDERQVNENKADSEITYDFIGTDPATLQPKLLITRVIGSPAFDQAFDELDDTAQLISAGVYGQNPSLQPFNVAARNSGIRLTFNRDLGLAPDFFIERDAQGNPSGIKNPEAVELVEIVGDPTDKDPIGDFKRITTRIAHRGNLIILDPVLLGVEGNWFHVPNRASGMPESTTQTLANMRINIALEGPLRIRGMTAKTDPRFIQTNLAGRKALVRDFRSGNKLDTTANLQNGFVREKIPPRLVGEMRMRLESVEKLSETVQRLTIFKAGVVHEIDRGDVLKLYPKGSQTGVPVAVTEVILDPEEDHGKPGEQRVRVRVRSVDEWKPYDPSSNPGFPASIPERMKWLIDNGPLVVLAAEFFGGDPKKGDGDDPENFITFTPDPVPDPGQTTVKPGENVSPFANIVLRFSKPVNLATVKPYDSMILSTLASARDTLDPKLGTPHLIASQIFDEDGSSTALRIAPPMGFFLSDGMRGATKKKQYPYYLHLVGGFEGIRDFAGNPVDFQRTDQSSTQLSFNTFEFFLDNNVEKAGNRFPNNRVVNIVRRFAALDEDESEKDQIDFFGPVAVVGGKAIGRSLTRGSSFVDDKNQLPSPPSFPFSFCQSGDFMALTASNPVGGPILNPLNPWGGRLENIWREIDLGLSRTNSVDFNLDVEQMWWAPYQQGAAGTNDIIYDVFDRISLFLGHCEYRPDNCIWPAAALPRYTQSGLQFYFDSNFARNLKIGTTNMVNPTSSQIEEMPPPHIAYENQQLVVQHKDIAMDPTNSVRYLPLPTFAKDKGYFTYRDEAVNVLGGGRGQPRILSPFGPENSRFWDSNTRTAPDDGQVGAIALPIMADFWSYVDDPKLPKDDPFFATGANGLQLSICVTSSAVPYFRVYSGGSLVLSQNAKYVRPGDRDFKVASGGWNPLTGARTAAGDPTQYWMRFDWLRRKSYMTYGFVNLQDPHLDASNNYGDPRLGSGNSYSIASTEVCNFQEFFEPPLSTLPTGVIIEAEYRGADSSSSGYKALDPRLPGNAHIRTASGQSWSYRYTNKLTQYTTNPNQLFQDSWLGSFQLDAKQVRIMNWRFRFQNNPEAVNPPPPTLDAYGLSYRIETRIK